VVAPSLLAVQRTATPSGQRLTGGVSLAAVTGGTYGVGESVGIADCKYLGSNRVTEFKGEFYAITISGGTGRVFRRTGGAWVEIHNEGAAVTNGYYFSGLYVVNVGGTEYLTGVFQSGGITRFFRTTDGTLWTSAAPIPGSIPMWQSNGCVYRGSLILVAADAAFGLGIFDPATLTLTTVVFASGAGNTGNSGTGCPCVFRNRLFLLKGASAATQLSRLCEVAAGGIVYRSGDLNAVAVTSGNPGINGRPVLFPVGSTKMVGILISNEGGSTYQHRAYDFTPMGTGFTTTEVSNPLLPVSLRTPTGGTFYTAGWTCFVDNDTTPGSPLVYLWLSPSFGGGTYSYFEYVDSASEMGPGSLVASADTYALSHQTRGGGERVNTTDSDLFIDSVALTPSTTPGWVQISFRARGAVGPADKFVRGWFSTFETANMTQMTLAGIATGGSATRNGNQIEQVEANPATLYTMQWDASGQGIASGQPCSIMLRLGTT